MHWALELSTLQLIEEGYENPEYGASQLITFRDQINKDDIVIAYRTENTVALIGEVTDPYDFITDNKVEKPEAKGGEIDYPNQIGIRWWEKPRDYHRSLLPGRLPDLVASRGTVKILDRNLDLAKFTENLNSISKESTTIDKIVEVTREDEMTQYLKKHVSDVEQDLVFENSEYGVSTGSIDILVLDRNGLPTIIEVKVKADDSAVGQILGYMEAYEQENPTEHVRGIIVAHEFTERCKKAAKRTNLKLCLCRKTFTFSSIA